jgi:predicted GNAT superfamily acetyltransferase
MINETLFANYLLEREGAKILENESGFLIYKITGEECFIKDLCVSKDVRQQSKCRDLIASLSGIAKQAGAKYLTGNIFIKDKGHMVTLIAAHALGFKLVGANNDVLMILKDLEE